jgi:hypothetical protein
MLRKTDSSTEGLAEIGGVVGVVHFGKWCGEVRIMIWQVDGCFQDTLARLLEHVKTLRKGGY